MSKSKITHQVTNPIVLGTLHYGGTLTVTGTGEVDPLATGAAAISAPADISGAKLINHVIVIGGPSADKLHNTAGSGVYFANTGYIGNDGTIEGGASVGMGAGGIGIDLAAGGTIANMGLIAGATGYGYNGPGGGAGIYFGGAGKLTNNGTITGGSGIHFGTGAIGVDLAVGGTVVNHGLIQGGLGGAIGYYGESGGAGLSIGGTAIISNSGTIQGGHGTGAESTGVGGAGISAAGGTLTNQGVILGGDASANGFQGAPGGNGVQFSQTAKIANTGTIQGAFGIGNGVVLEQGGTLNNAGIITGGNGFGGYYDNGSVGGAGVIFDGGGVIANSGMIDGGVGSYSFNFAAGAGGAGVAMDGAGTLLNHGTITGGDGNFAVKSQYQGSGVGGDGVTLAGGATLNNSGLIAGGTIKTYADYGGGNGGAGVYINGGTLITSGAIDGGAPGANGPGVQGDAVQFGKIAGTLEIAPSANFSGNIAANASAGDTLVLAGSAAGTLAGFGTSVTGFATIVENAHAEWTLSGTIDNPGHGQGDITMETNARLDLTGAVTIGSIAFGGNDLLVFGTPGAVTSVLSGFGTGDTIDLSGIQAGSLSYAGGTLTLYGPGQHIVNTLAFSGDYTTGDFGLHADGAGGTDIVFTGTPEARLMEAGFTHNSTAENAGPPALGQWHAVPPGW